MRRIGNCANRHKQAALDTDRLRATREVSVDPLPAEETESRFWRGRGLGTTTEVPGKEWSRTGHNGLFACFGVGVSSRGLGGPVGVLAGSGGVSTGFGGVRRGYGFWWCWRLGAGSSVCGVDASAAVVSGVACSGRWAVMLSGLLARRDRRVCLRLWMTAAMSVASVCAAVPNTRQDAG